MLRTHYNMTGLTTSENYIEVKGEKSSQRYVLLTVEYISQILIL